MGEFTLPAPLPSSYSPVPEKYRFNGLPTPGTQSYVPPTSAPAPQGDAGKKPDGQPSASGAEGNAVTEYLKHNTDFILLIPYNGAQFFFKSWRAGSYISGLTGGPAKPMLTVAGTFPVGPVSLPLPSVTSYNLTEGQRLVLGGMTFGTGVVDMATDLADNYAPQPRYGLDGFEMAIFGPTLDGISDYQTSRQMLSYSYVGDTKWKYMYTTYFALRLLTDAELTQSNQIGESVQTFWDGLTGDNGAVSDGSLDDCDWKGNCGGKDVRMLDAPFGVADHIGAGMRGVDSAVAATGLQQTLLADGQPTGGNLAAGFGMPLVAMVMRHDPGDTWDFTGRDGGLLLRDVALQGGGFLLAYTTHDDPETQYRMTNVLPMLMMGAETPRGMQVLYNTEDAGIYDDEFYLGANVLYGFQNFMGSIAATNAAMDATKPTAARIVPGAVAVVGLGVTTIYMDQLGVKAREGQYQANGAESLDPRWFGLEAAGAGVGVALLWRGARYAFFHDVDPFGMKPQFDPKKEAWNGQPVNVDFNVAPTLVPGASGAMNPGLQAGLSFNF